MLKKITIKNFAIIDELELSFENGMSVLTGETGAGKSIIIDAIELVMGKRANKDVIGLYGDRTDILVELDIVQNLAIQKLLKEFDLDDGDACVIRRVIREEGSKSYINGIPVNLKVIQSLAELCINIHGQHEFQTLLKSEQQRVLLDQFAVSVPSSSSELSSLSFPQRRESSQNIELDHAQLLNAIEQTYNQWLDCKQTLSRLTEENQDTSAKKEFLTYQIAELNALNLGENEFEEISEQHKKLANSDLLLTHSRQALSLLSENEISVQDILNQAVHSISAIQQFDDSLANVTTLLENAQIHTQEASAELNAFLNRLDLDPEQFDYLETRLSKIHALARKHHIQPEALFEFHQDLQAQLLDLDDSDERIETLAQQLSVLENDYFILAEQLSQNRLEAAQELARRVTQNIQKLGMPGGRFDILLERYDEPKRHGLEKIVFLVSANPGQPVQPLTKVVSGGELSRISLAIQVITAGATPILIFDEVDVGVGGAVAEIVGKLLRLLAEKNQIFCITHLAQVAACGQHHYQVSKSQSEKITRTQVQKLTLKERTFEIARMLGGVELTPQAIAHAEQMLENN